MELNGEEQERIFKLYRLDHYEQVDGQGKPTELAPDSYLNYPPTNFTLGQLSIELNPFYWLRCDFVFDQEFESIDWLRSWSRKWIDEEDQNPTDEKGLSGVIHNVTRPTQTKNGFQFTVDFGAANEESFIEILQTIEETGVMRVRIGSFEMIE